MKLPTAPLEVGNCATNGFGKKGKVTLVAQGLVTPIDTLGVQVGLPDAQGITPSKLQCLDTRCLVGWQIQPALKANKVHPILHKCIVSINT